MEVHHENYCQTILNDIRHSEPLERIRNGWTKLQQRCVSENKNSTRIQEVTENIFNCSNSWINSCKSCGSSPRLVLTANKMSVEISQDTDSETVANFIKGGIFNFGIDLFYGSVQQNLDVLVRLLDVALEESNKQGFSIPMSIYLKLSPRLHYTGGLKKNVQSFKLMLNGRVMLTTNRKYASRSCRSIIYVNAKFLLFDLQKCDIICLNGSIQLQVAEVNDDHAMCKVIVPGVVTARMPVKFPERFQWASATVSAEELEDLTFAVGTNINVVVSYAPGSPADYKQLVQTLNEFKCNHFYLFIRLTLGNVDDSDSGKWIASAYDGFLIDCSSGHPNDKIVKLTPAAQAFIQKSYRKRKPIFLRGSWSMFVDPCDYEFTFYYPDKYVMPCESGFMHLFEAIFNKLAASTFSESDFPNKSSTGGSSLARSIAAASFDFQADAIVMCAIVGATAKKIAHFRPRTPIIAVTSIKSATNYTSMHHNTWMLFFDTNTDRGISHENDTHQKLVYGVRYAQMRELVDINSTIILVFRKILRCGFADKFVVVKFDESYVETIRKAVLQK